MTEQAGELHAHSPVPEGVTVPGWRVGLIVASFSIGLPDFLNGAHNALALGLRGAVGAAFLAALILCVGGCFTAVVSVRTRLSTYLLVRRSFGIGGAALINTVIALIHFCWFGVNASFFGEAIMQAAEANGLAGNFTLSVILGSALMTASTIIGFKALDRLAVVAVPVLAVILALVVWASLDRYGMVTTPASAPAEPMGFGIAISALIGAYMLAVATMPDLSRYTRTTRGAIASMVLSFPIATPLMMTAAAIPALATGETSIMKLVTQFGFGTPVLFLLVLPTWTVNALNLYSSSLSLGTTFPRVRPWLFTVLGGTIGAAFALMGILDAFIPFLLFLGLIIPPIAAIYVIDALTIWRGADSAASIAAVPAVRWPALATWLGSIIVAVLAAYQGWTATTVPALDATIFAALVYALVRRRFGAGARG
ncbi:cytosine permease [Sphingomonas sp. DG1-23]|uniref:cytosine permease n=1 Tax=Sphingomonas sp. DG1-23 TaxID=3068316 RepID=UPI00273D231C|nr:cytosine permease [Sphingomonas sp. DG1-23]MDP5280105.1 cytosine permease [Sphingomonas sp. DG1-23]